MGKLFNPNLTKIHRSYTVEEVAILYDIHKNTVRAWLKQGLPICDDRRPLLILGAALRQFLQEKRAIKKHPCKDHELFCMRCKTPRHPAGNMADYIDETPTRGKLMAICPECMGMMNKYFSLANLPLIQGKLDITLP